MKSNCAWNTVHAALPNDLALHAVGAEEGVIIIIDFLLELSYMSFFPLGGTDPHQDPVWRSLEWNCVT